MEANRLNPTDRVTVRIAIDGNHMFTFTGSGFHNIDSAAEAAYRASGITAPVEDCVFTVADDTEGTGQRYRYNAHGHLRLII